MRIIKVPLLVEASRRYPKARKWVENWGAITKVAQWRHLQEVRRAYPSADAVAVKSGRTVTVFNVCGNDYRLLTAIHYNRGIVYTLRFMTHAEYSKNKWKNNL
jgi:mRNA interferase HigB